MKRGRHWNTWTNKRAYKENCSPRGCWCPQLNAKPLVHTQSFITHSLRLQSPTEWCHFQKLTRFLQQWLTTKIWSAKISVNDVSFLSRKISLLKKTQFFHHIMWFNKKKKKNCAPPWYLADEKLKKIRRWLPSSEWDNESMPWLTSGHQV